MDSTNKEKCLDKITSKIMENDDYFVIFYNDWCGFSMNAIELLKEHNCSFKGYNIDKICGKMDSLLISLLRTKKITNYDPKHKTRPIIFHKGKFVGGYTELQIYLDLL